MQVKVKVPEPYKALFDLPEGTRLVILMGGRGSGKTYIATLWGTFLITIADKKIQVLRDEKSQIQASIMNEYFLRYDKVNKDGVFDAKFTKQFDGIKNNKTGEKVLFSQGFRASTTDKKANLKGVSNVDVGMVEEGEDVRNENLFNMWTDSIRNEGSMIVFICNTPDIHHFIVHRYFNYIAITQEDEPHIEQKYLDGYYKLVPKGIKGVTTIFTTHEDNPHLPEMVRENYRNYGNPESHLWNPHYYLTAIKGYSTTGLTGQIFKFYELMEDEDYQALPYEEIIGIDFGTASPAGIIGVKLHKGDMWVRELNYSPFTLKEMAFKLCELGIDSDTLCIADCAEPSTIRSLRFGIGEMMDDSEKLTYPTAADGFRNIRPSPDKRISEGIETILSLRLHVTKGSANLLKELTMYTWATDRDGKPTGKPVDAYNHCFVGSTMVACVDGDKRIDEVLEGDMVLTRNGFRRILKVWDNGVKSVTDYELRLEKSVIRVTCTPNHKVWERQGWIEISKLMERQYTHVYDEQETDEVYPFVTVWESGNWPKNRSVYNVRELGGRDEKVYDLMVEGEHEYFANGLLVHNCIDPMRYIVQYYGRLY